MGHLSDTFAIYARSTIRSGVGAGPVLGYLEHSHFKNAVAIETSIWHLLSRILYFAYIVPLGLKMLSNIYGSNRITIHRGITVS